MMLTAALVNGSDIKAIKEEDLVTMVAQRASKTVDETQIRNMDRSISKLRMNLKTEDAEERVWNLWADYVEALKDAGFMEFPKSHLHIAIRHLFNRI